MRRLPLLVLLGIACHAPTAPHVLGPCTITVVNVRTCYTHCVQHAEIFAQESNFPFTNEWLCG